MITRINMLIIHNNRTHKSATSFTA